ncbi:MAG: ROK family transcriptional regulator [Lawsonibacter sp.]
MDITDIKAENIKRILNTLRFSSGMTKRDIALTTGLSFSTVSNLCNELKENQVLYEEKLNDYSVGRTPNQLIFSGEKYCSICVDFQQEDVLNFAILDFSNNRLYETHLDTSRFDDISRWISFIDATYRSLIRSGHFSGVQFAGIGVSVPGIYDRTTGHIVNCSTTALNNIPLQHMLRERLGLPCFVDNESNLCALSVRQSHADSDNIVYLHSSSGLGVGIICDGKLLRGSNGYAAEVSHIPLGDRNTVCPFCASRGCIENDLAQRGMDALQFPALTVEEHQQLIQNRGQKLGELLSILVNLFDPTALYIGGNAMTEYEAMAPYVIPILNQRAHLIMDRGLQIFHDTNSVQTIEQGINQSIYENWNPLEKTR